MRKTIIAASAAALLALAGCGSDDGGVQDAVSSGVDQATAAAGDAAASATAAAGEAAASATDAAGAAGEGENTEGNNADGENAEGNSAEGENADGENAEGEGGSGDMGTIALPDGSEIEAPAGIAQKYEEIQGSSGHLGAPVGEAQSVAGGQMLEFEGGTLIQNPDGEAFLVQGEILKEYMANGGPESDLGFPTSDETPQDGGFISTFENGEITYDIATEQSTVTQN